jgi:uncharacterized membrane protein
MTKKNLTIAGAMIYACEGTKLRRDKRHENYYNYAIELTNSTPETIKAPWEKVHGQLFLYPDHNKNKLIRYWSKISNIPISQFQQVIMLKQKNSKYMPNPLGTFKIRYNSKIDFIKLQSIILKTWKDAGVLIDNKGRVA